MSPVPVVTVGMPAYNAATTIRDSIESVLAQQVVDFELVISDNASTDGTWDIVDEYRRREPRVIAIRHAENIGANGNYSSLVRAARGRYFKWSSSNDLCAPRFLADCVALLERCGQAVLAAPRTRLFRNGVEDAVDYDDDIAIDDDHPVRRFVAVLERLKLNNMINGVIRTAALRKTPLIAHYPGADNVLLAHLALLGPLHLLDERHFYRRMDAATATRLMSTEAVHRHHYPRKTLRALFPNWRFEAGLARAVFAAGLPLGTTIQALTCVARSAYRNSASLGEDLLDAVRHPLRG